MASKNAPAVPRRRYADFCNKIRQEQPFDGRFLNFHGQDSFFAVTGGWP
jgi:hypothetical protein